MFWERLPDKDGSSRTPSERDHCSCSGRDPTPRHGTASASEFTSVHATGPQGPSCSARACQRPHQFCDDRCVLACGLDHWKKCAKKALWTCFSAFDMCPESIRRTRDTSMVIWALSTTVTRPIGPSAGSRLFDLRDSAAPGSLSCDWLGGACRRRKEQLAFSQEPKLQLPDMWATDWAWCRLIHMDAMPQQHPSRIGM